MIREVLKHAGWLSLVGGIAASACSSPAATADAYVNSNAVGCDNAGLLTAVGTEAPGGNLPATEPNGTLQGSQAVVVTCTVSAGGDGYTLDLYASGGGGTTIVKGTATADGGTSLHGVFETDTATLSSGDCSLSYTFNGASVSNRNPIAPGQVWGHISCPQAAVQGLDGAMCDVESDVMFVNCVH